MNLSRKAPGCLCILHFNCEVAIAAPARLTPKLVAVTPAAHRPDWGNVTINMQYALMAVIPKHHSFTHIDILLVITNEIRRNASS